MKMPEKRCDACKWWSDQHTGTARGWCSFPNLKPLLDFTVASRARYADDTCLQWAHKQRKAKHDRETL